MTSSLPWDAGRDRFNGATWLRRSRAGLSSWPAILHCAAGKGENFLVNGDAPNAASATRIGNSAH